MAQKRVFVIGVGMTKFEKPGKKDWDYPDMGQIAGERAMADATISYDQVEQVCVGYCYGDSTCGQRAVYQMGMTGVPVYNVNNNCSTGSTALFMAKQFVQGGLSECVMALGFEKMERARFKAAGQGQVFTFLDAGKVPGLEACEPQQSASAGGPRPCPCRPSRAILEIDV